jgi:hypothetical protein
MEYRASMDGLSASTVNVRIAAVRKLVGEALAGGWIGVDEAATAGGDLDCFPNASRSHLQNDRTQQSRHPQ